MQYAVLDSLRIGYELDRVRQLAPVWLSLYRGPADAQQEEMAPLLAGYEPGDAFANWFSQAQPDSVGIGVETDVSADELRKHLRRFLLVDLEATADTPSRQVYFRYYDPSILRVFLPTCDETQLTTFFGPILAVTAYDETIRDQVRFSRQGRQLVINQPT